MYFLHLSIHYVQYKSYPEILTTHDRAGMYITIVLDQSKVQEDSRVQTIVILSASQHVLWPFVNPGCTVILYVHASHRQGE